MSDAYDRWIEWADKRLDSMLTFPALERDAIMALPFARRRDRAAVNEAVKRAHEADALKGEDPLLPLR
jgi:hypothetical protein